MLTKHLFTGSLPLMGMNRSVAGPATRGGRRTHYPSWGSGTVSLPLMGIPQANRWTPPAVPLLITPHGDREPGGQTRSNAGHAQLITPHGDRETRIGSSRRMELITPHGDREQFLHGTTKSHYPSWGSGTQRRCLHSHRRRGSHYPSWGSGTGWSTGRANPAHYPSWGSGTRAILHGTCRGRGHAAHYPSWGSHACSESSCEQRLITPHGDREPAFAIDARPRPSPGRSLPLMGIGNILPKAVGASR